MKMKKLIAIMLTLMMMLTVTTACGGGGGESEEPAEETTVEALDSDSILKIVFDDLGIGLSQGSEIKISLPDDDGNVTVTFKVMDKDCEYVINQVSGEIISKNVPEGVVEEANAAGDPVEQAINAAFDSVDGYQGGAENISVDQKDNIITVEFDWNGEHYVKTYDTNEGKIID